jgi:integrase
METKEMKRLTAEAVRKLKPTHKTKTREIADSGAKGLRLVVHPSGGKSWIMRFRRPDSSQAKLTLGAVNAARPLSDAPVLGQPLTLEEARALASEVNRQRALGVDVAATHAARRKQLSGEVAAETFAAAARRFVSEHAKRHNRSWSGTARVLGLDADVDLVDGGLADRWRDKKLAEIDAGDVYGAISEAVRTGIPGTAARKTGSVESRGREMAKALSRMFRWCVAHRLVSTNPAREVYRPPPAPSRHRVLTDAEVAKLWAATADGGAFYGVVRLLLLTGQRRGEVAGMRWSELSEDLSTWSLPPQRTKNKLPHVVHLPAAAREVVSSVPRIVDQDLLFSTNGARAISGWSKFKRKLDAEIGFADWRLHDLRRTAASGMQRLGVRLEVIERTLNHVSGSFSGVAGIYQRDPMHDETRAALERWAAHVSGESARVVPMRGRRR